MYKLSFKRQVLTGFAASLIFVFISALASYLSIQSFNESSTWIEHTYEVIKTAEKTEVELINAETGLRGYIITNKPSFKTPYNNSINQVSVHLNTLKDLVKDNPDQKKISDSLAYYAIHKVEDMKNIMNIATTVGLEAAKQEILTERGQLFKIKFLSLSDQFIANELQLLNDRKIENKQRSSQTTWIVLLSSLIIFGLILFLLRYIRHTFDQQKETEREILNTNAELAQISALNEHNNWLLSGAAEINTAMQGEQEIYQLSSNIIAKIANYLGASVGALFLLDEQKKLLYISGTYAYTAKNTKTIKLGEGLIGQIALEKNSELISEVPDDYIKIKSALGDTNPRYLFLVPIIFENRTIAVLELGFILKPQDNKLNLISNNAENIGIALNSALAHLQLKELFEQTQQQAEELVSQQEELRTTNEELVHKTEALQASEEELRVQQEELQQTNTELEEKAQQLEERNLFINEAKEAISLKAEELALSSKYKSEFLANMSHELRTPLNSLQILASELIANRDGNLSEKQIQFAKTINACGDDLIQLINDILDFSKIESGNMELEERIFDVRACVEEMLDVFASKASEARLDLMYEIGYNVPQQIVGDEQRLRQVLLNLVGNAIKFTSKGEILVRVQLQQQHEEYVDLLFEVIDTGIGIPEDKLSRLFRAFSQVDSSTTRKYGGTGLGLVISEKLIRLMGGVIGVESKEGEGSNFHFTIHSKISKEPIQSYRLLHEVSFDNKRILVIDDNQTNLKILKQQLSSWGLEVVLVERAAQALTLLADETLIFDAIITDRQMPGMDGIMLAQNIREQRKNLPIVLLTSVTDDSHKNHKDLFAAVLTKPVKQHLLSKTLLMILKKTEKAQEGANVIQQRKLFSDLSSILTVRNINHSIKNHIFQFFICFNFC